VYFFLAPRRLCVRPFVSSGGSEKPRSHSGQPFFEVPHSSGHFPAWHGERLSTQDLFLLSNFRRPPFARSHSGLRNSGFSLLQCRWLAHRPSSAGVDLLLISLFPTPLALIVFKNGLGSTESSLKIVVAHEAFLLCAIFMD